MKFRIKDSVTVREIEDKIVYYDTKRTIFYGLKGALVPYFVQNKVLEIPKMVEYLLEEYDVDELTAAKDVDDVRVRHVEYSVPVSQQMMFETILHWNEICFIVDVKAEYQGIALEKYLGCYQMKKDCISIILFDYTMKSEIWQVRSIDVYLYKQHGIVQGKTEYENIRTSYLQQFGVFRVEIPWDILGILPVFGSCFGFNMRWQHMDDREREFGEVSIIDNPVWHDVVSMRHIILQ